MPMQRLTVTPDKLRPGDRFPNARLTVSSVQRVEPRFPNDPREGLYKVVFVPQFEGDKIGALYHKDLNLTIEREGE